MRSIIAVLLVLAYCEAKPNPDFVIKASQSSNSYIIGGTDAERGEFPWQLSQERLGASWSHWCGGSLLSARYTLSAAHCVDGSPTAIIRVVAGLHNRDDKTDTVIANVQSYRMHETYNAGPGTFPNDIAILTLATEIAANGGNIQYAVLPRDNSDQFAGRSLVISGWGRDSPAQSIPNTLQKATIGVIDTARCNELLAPVNGALATDGNICLYDAATSTGACNGDSGGPANIRYPDESSDIWAVAGLTSWAIEGGNPVVCLQTFPSVYIRTSAYLDWIETHTP